MTQFVKIPKDMIKKHPGSVLKLYGAIESHCRKNKTFCYPGNKRLSELTNIKTKATLLEAKKILEADNRITIEKRGGKSNIYKLMETDSKYKLVPLEALLLSNNSFKLYCALLYISAKKKTKIAMKHIKKISGITDGRTILKCLTELHEKHTVKIVNMPKHYNNGLIIHKNNVVISELLCGNYYTTMWELLNHYVVIIEPEATYIEVTLLEATFAKQTKTESSDIAQPYMTENTKIPLPELIPKDKGSHKSQKKEKEIFVAEPDSVNESYSEESLDNMIDSKFIVVFNNMLPDEQNKLPSRHWDRFKSIQYNIEPPKINRKNERAKNSAYLAGKDYFDYLDAKKTGFNGHKDIVEKYVKHEMLLWDHKKLKLPEDQLAEKFQKEMFMNHKVAQHFKSMTDEQRQKEIELYA